MPKWLRGALGYRGTDDKFMPLYNNRFNLIK